MSDKPVRFFEKYTVLVTETDLVAAMRDQIEVFQRLLGEVDRDRSNRVDPPYAWTIKQVMQHIIDAERVFGYRAMRFARRDSTPLPGFDENAYAAAVDVTDTDLPSLVDEHMMLRMSHVAMFGRFSSGAWARNGTASNIDWGVTDLAKAIIGHARHHLQIIEKRLTR